MVYAHVSQAQQRPQPAVPGPDLPPRAEPAAEAASSPEPQTTSAQPTTLASVGTRPASSTSFVFTPLPKRKPITFWAAFTNPNLDSRLALDKASTQLVVLPRGSRLQATFAEVPKVTIDEHGKIVQDFLAHIDPADRQYFQQIASAPNSWPQWSFQIKEYAGGKYLATWLNFRTEALRKMLEDRLAKLGLDQNAGDPVIKSLLESKQRRPRQPEPNAKVSGPSPLYTSEPIIAQTHINEDELRRLATIAISQMSTEELRRLWLPLGAFVTGFRRNEA